MSEIIVTFKNENIKEKILFFLSKFEADGVTIQANSQNLNEFSDEYVEKNWRKLAQGTSTAHLNDDEMLEQAHWEHYVEKYNS